MSLLIEGIEAHTVSCEVSMDFPIWHKLPTCPAGSGEQKNWRLSGFTLDVSLL